MKRRMTLALVLAMSLSAAFAMAEETNSLKDFTSRLKGGTVQTQTAEPEPRRRRARTRAAMASR